MTPSPTSPEQSTGVDQTRWFAEEVQPHEQALRAYLRRKFPTLSDVDDLVQESFVKALRAQELGKLTSTRGFLFQVARNSAVSFFRKQRLISGTPVNELEASCVLENDADTVENLCTRDELDLIAEAVASLPARCRQIVLLRLTEGLDYPVIARRLGVSESTVRVQIARGMKKCSQFLRDLGVIKEDIS